MREHLAGEDVLADLVVPLLPEVSWTRRPVKNVWAHWSLKTSGQAAGRAVIRVNSILQAPRTQVPDELLEYLMFHELLHHLLPGRGHDAEFRRLEAKWPNADALDLMLDTLHEQFDFARPPRM
jgi:predicted metal-dependent hydrolase